AVDAEVDSEEAESGWPALASAWLPPLLAPVTLPGEGSGVVGVVGVVGAVGSTAADPLSWAIDAAGAMLTAASKNAAPAKALAPFISFILGGHHLIWAYELLG